MTTATGSYIEASTEVSIIKWEGPFFIADPANQLEVEFPSSPIVWENPSYSLVSEEGWSVAARVPVRSQIQLLLSCVKIYPVGGQSMNIIPFRWAETSLGPLTSTFALTRGSRMTALAAYLRKRARQGLVAQNTVTGANRTWKRLDEVFSGTLDVPVAAVGPDGQILLTWDKEEHHAEIEIEPNSEVSFFYMNRDNLKGLELEFDPVYPSTLVRDKLRIFSSR